MGEDLNLDPTSRSVLIIAWKFKAQQQCEFSREEFIGGMVELGCDAIDKLKSKLINLDKEILDPNKFKEFYQFTFKFLNLWSTFLKEHSQSLNPQGHLEPSP